MTTQPNTPLVESFLNDHQEMMRLLRDVSKALDATDIGTAKGLALQLNHTAGPHVAFEETVLYPLILDETDDRAFVESLYDEHQAIVSAIDALLEDSDSLDAIEVGKAFRKGLEHAEHCVRLISRLSGMCEDDQREAFEELSQLRTNKVTWTELRKGK